MFSKNKILFLFLALVVISEGSSEIHSKYWLISCTLSGCSFAFSSCMNCFGERACKTCITLSKPECSVCADDIYNKDDLETINGQEYLICDLMDPIQSKVCHLFCRGQFQQSGQCVVENNLPICKCSSQPGSFTTDLFTSTTRQTQQTFTTTTVKESTTTSNRPVVNFNATVKLNVPISGGYQRILPLPNGDLVRGSGGNTVEIWDLQKGLIKRTLTSVYSNPNVFGLLSNGDLVAGYHHNKTLLVWDLEITNGEPLKRIMQAIESFWSLTVLKNDDLAIGQNGNNFDIVIRNSQNGNLKNKLVGHRSTVHQIIELENGNLVSCSHDKTVKVWNVTNGSILKSLTHSTYVWSITFLKNGYLVSGLYDGTINIWNLETNQLIRNLIGHTSRICATNCLHVLDNGDLLSGSYDKSLKIWNPYDGKVKLTSNLHKYDVYQLAVLPNGKFISSSHYELVVWN